MGNETIVPSSKMGLTMPPFAESNPFRLSIIFIPHAPSKLWSNANSASSSPEAAMGASSQAVSRNALFFGVRHYPGGIFYSSSSARKLSGRTESIIS